MNTSHTIVLPDAADNESGNIEQATIFFIGTATVLLRYAGFTILTDPNFLHAGDHVHLGYGLQATRLTDPAITLEELPPVDMIILSHMHEDHFDRLVARKLPKSTPIVTTPKAMATLRKKHFYRTSSLKPWETLTLVKGERKCNITSLPGKHGPGPVASVLPPVMGSMIEFEVTPGKTALRLYISGDTLFTKDIPEIAKQYPDIDVALLHLGGTKIAFLTVTMDAKQGIKALKTLNPHRAIPIHFDDYNIFKSPLEDFKKAVAASGLTEHVIYLDRGQTATIDVVSNRR